MRTVRELLADEVPVASVLGTMPDRSLIEQKEVWNIGLGKIAGDVARAANREAGQLIKRVAEGAISGLFFDPLDVAEAYCRAELKQSRSREEGERKRQNWLMGVLVKIGEARATGCSMLAELPDVESVGEEPAAVADGA